MHLSMPLDKSHRRFFFPLALLEKPRKGTQSGRKSMEPRSKLVVYLFSSALADAIIPIFYIFLPLFASSLGANALELGLVGGTSYAVYSFMPFVMGHFSDRWGSRKFFIITSLLILFVVSLLYSVADNVVTLITVRVFEGLGWAMLWPAMEAAITEDQARDPRSSLAIFNYTWSAGAACGPVIGTLLVSTFSYRAAFLASAILLVIPILLNGAAFLREGPLVSQRSLGNARSSTKQQSTLPLAIRRVFSTGGERRGFAVWSSLILMALSTATSAVFFTFFGPYATSIGMAVVLIGAVTTTFGVVRFFAYIALAKKSLGRRVFDAGARARNLVAFACVSSLSSLLLFVKDATGAVYFLSFVLFGIGYSVVYAISQTTLIAETASGQRGAGAGLFESSIGVGGIIGPIAAGAVSSSSLTNAFTVPPAGLALALALLYVLSKVAQGPRKDSPSGQATKGSQRKRE